MLWAAPAVLFAVLHLGSQFSLSGVMIDSSTAVPDRWRVEFRPGSLDVYRLGAAGPPSAIPLFGRKTFQPDGVWLGESRIVSRFAGISQTDGHIAQFQRRAIPFTAWSLSLRTACLLSCVLAFPAAVALRRHRQRRRARTTPLCDVCGYDLRATPERCPECGSFAEAWERGITADAPDPAGGIVSVQSSAARRRPGQ